MYLLIIKNEEILREIILLDEIRKHTNTVRLDATINPLGTCKVQVL